MKSRSKSKFKYFISSSIHMYTCICLCVSLCVCLCLLTGCGQTQNPHENTPSTQEDAVQYPILDYSWLEDNHTIAHAFGGIEEYTYTNSLEAFEANYAAGHRLFEVDFMLTTDDITVAGHDWAHFYSITGRETDENGEAAPLSLEEYLSSSIYGKFTPLTWCDIVELMAEHPDMYIVTDTKDTVDPMITTTFTQIVKEAQAVNPDILDRIIPQIYNNEMYDIIMDIYPWKSLIYTCYNQGDEFSYDNVYAFASSRGIKVIATFPARGDNDFVTKIQEMGGCVFLHTFNDLEQVETYISSHNIHGVYKDFLTPDVINPLFR